jgi:hypothetical protein
MLPVAPLPDATQTQVACELNSVAAIFPAQPSQSTLRDNGFNQLSAKPESGLPKDNVVRLLGYLISEISPKCKGPFYISELPRTLKFGRSGCRGTTVPPAFGSPSSTHTSPPLGGNAYWETEVPG